MNNRVKLIKREMAKILITLLIPVVLIVGVVGVTLVPDIISSLTNSESDIPIYSESTTLAFTGTEVTKIMLIFPTIMVNETTSRSMQSIAPGEGKTLNDYSADIVEINGSLFMNITATEAIFALKSEYSLVTDQSIELFTSTTLYSNSKITNTPNSMSDNSKIPIYYYSSGDKVSTLKITFTSSSGYCNLSLSYIDVELRMGWNEYQRSGYELICT